MFLTKFSFLLSLIVLSSVQTFASTIDFDNLKPFANFAQVPDGYGSTADVNVSYRTLSSNGSVLYDMALLWNDGYVNLPSVAIPTNQSGILERP